MNRLASALLICLIASTTSGDECRTVFRASEFHVAEAELLLLPQSVNYFVGAPVRVEALVQRALAADPEYRAYRQFKVWQAAQAATQRAASVDRPTPAAAVRDLAAEPLDPAVFARPLIRANCIRCHAGEKPKGGFDLSGPLSAKQIVEAQRKVYSREMPPAKAGVLSTAEQSAILRELLGVTPQRSPPASERSSP